MKEQRLALAEKRSEVTTVSAWTKAMSALLLEKATDGRWLLFLRTLSSRAATY
eukprot:m.39141 g.39141  ORF g.39141 m.39141 type:complete len:53 (+) comp11564_c1_seq2:47-205(+)